MIVVTSSVKSTVQDLLSTISNEEICFRDSEAFASESPENLEETFLR